MNSWQCKKWSTIIGTVLVMLPIGLPFYWGNMAVYARSYIAQYGSTDGLQTPWVNSFFLVFNGFGLITAGFLSKMVGMRVSLGVGIVLFLGGMFLTDLTINESLGMVNLTLGFVGGLGAGMIYGMALQYAVGWAGKYLGLITCVIQSGFYAGPIFINLFISGIANPNNLSPDTEFGFIKLFSQPEVVNRVPLLIKDVGIMCTVLEIVGFLMVREASAMTEDEEMALTSKDWKNMPPAKVSTHTSGDPQTKNIAHRKFHKNLPTHKNHTTKPLVKTSYSSQSDLNSQSTAAVSETKLSAPSYGTSQTNLISPEEEIQTTLIAVPSCSPQTNVPAKPVINNPRHPIMDLKPYEVIRKKYFWILTLALLMYNNAALIAANYYKENGARYINNDHFLTSLGTFFSLASAISLPIWGIVSDYIAIKMVIVITACSSTILNILMYFTPGLSKWAYMATVTLMGCFLPPLFSILASGLGQLYGKTYYSSNIGVMCMVSYSTNFVNPFVFEAILNLGWFYIFLFGGCLTAGIALLTTLILPEI